jgi:hypothetical protein
MKRTDPRVTSAGEQPSNCAPGKKPYQPPAVAWEEEFDAVAASPFCPDPNNPDCP